MGSFALAAGRRHSDGAFKERATQYTTFELVLRNEAEVEISIDRAIRLYDTGRGLAIGGAPRSKCREESLPEMRKHW
jgi:hypothetical protein